MSEELPIATVGNWLDLPAADWSRLRDLTHEQVFTQELLPTASQLVRSNVAMAELRGYFLELVRDRRTRLREDPVSQWIRTWDSLEPDQDKADQEVYYLALFVLLAALETTSTLLSTMTLLLVETPATGTWSPPTPTNSYPPSSRRHCAMTLLHTSSVGYPPETAS